MWCKIKRGHVKGDRTKYIDQKNSPYCSIQETQIILMIQGTSREGGGQINKNVRWYLFFILLKNNLFISINMSK